VIVCCAIRVDLFSASINLYRKGQADATIPSALPPSEPTFPTNSRKNQNFNTNGFEIVMTGQVKKYQKKVFFGVVAGIGTRIISIFTGLVTMPMFFRYLTKDTLAVWMLFVGTEIFVNLTDLGFSQVLQRHIAFELGKEDRDGMSNCHGPSYFLCIAKWIGKYTSILLFLLLMLCGGWLLSSLTLNEKLFNEAMLSLMVFSFGKMIIGRFKYFETALTGHGEVGWQNWIFTFSVLLALVGFYFVLRYMHGSLVLLSTVSFLQGIVIVLGNAFIFIRKIPKQYRLQIPTVWEDAKPYCHPALDMFVVSLGAFLILNTDQYFIVRLLGPQFLPDYAATYRLLLVIYSTATTLSVMTIPFVCRISASEDKSNLKKLLLTNTSLGMVIFLSGILMFVFFGDYLIKLWLGPGHFVGWPILWVFCAMLTLENHHVIFAQVGINCKTDPTWGKMSVISGVINLLLTYIGAKTYGLLGVASATMLSQMMTNNWYAVSKTMKAVGLSIREYFREAAIVWVSFLIASSIILYSIRVGVLGEVTSLCISFLTIVVLFVTAMMVCVKKVKCSQI
jgi:O-antigen/teichoic acid export membrane protein